MHAKTDGNWKSYFWVSLIFLLLTIILSVVTRAWVLTAIPVGFLFGFFLQKGDLCGASAFSEVILTKDTRKVVGIWILIVVSMLGFAAFDLLHLVQLNPKPMRWLSYMVGGIIFGVGMVLAGGCVSGCLYKAGTGNLNSMAAIVGIPLGIAAVEYGPLFAFHSAMKAHKISNADGSVITFSTISGLPFWVLAILFSLVTLVIIFMRQKNKPNPGVEKKNEDLPLLQRILTRSWKPWQAGLMIGLLAAPAYLSSAMSGRNYPLGVTHGVLQAELLLTDTQHKHVWTSQQPSATAQEAPLQSQAQVTRPGGGKKIVWWLVLLVGSLVAGSWVSGRMSGQAKLLPKPPEQTVVAFFGGILVGAGAALATGCVVGNIMSGIALMSVGVLIFTVATILSNWLTTWIYMMGGWGRN